MEEKNNHSNSSTNLLLFLILAVLLFGASAVWGFFKNVFLLVIGIIIFVVVIWIISKLPLVTQEIVKEQKDAYRKNPVLVMLIFSLCIIFFVWLIIASISQERNESVVTQNVLTPTTQQENVKKFNYQKAKEAGYTDEEIQRYIKQRREEGVELE